MRSTNYGSDLAPGFTRVRYSGGWIYNEGAENPSVWLIGHAIRPGEFYFAINEENGKNVQKVIIEEPVINSNIPKEIRINTALQVTASLDNTELDNLKVSDVKAKAEGMDSCKPGNKYNLFEKEMIGYQPRIEIVSGKELVERGKGDYTNILTCTEKMKFIGEGMVKFKVVYEMIPIKEIRSVKVPDVTYSPEAIFTVNVVKEAPKTSSGTAGTSGSTSTAGTPGETVVPDKNVVLDYTTGTLPTNEELITTISNSEEQAVITINANDALVLERSVLNECVKGKHKLQVNRLDEDKKLLYSWEMSLDEKNVSEWNTDILVGIENVKLNEALGKSTDGETRKIVQFGHEGKLPGRASVRIYLGGDFKADSTAYYYYFNEATGKFEEIGAYTIDQEGYVTVAMEHCSDYVFVNKEIDESKVIESPDNKLDKVDKKGDKEEKNSNDGKARSAGKVLLAVMVCLVFLTVIGVVLYLLWKRGILKKLCKRDKG